MRVFDEGAADEVPNHLKDPSRDGKGLGHGKGYRYPHAYRDHWVAQQYLPDGLRGATFYQPGSLGFERGIQEKLASLRERSTGRPRGAAGTEEREADADR